MKEVKETIKGKIDAPIYTKVPTSMVVGFNRCTTCVHYAIAPLNKSEDLTGCKHLDVYRLMAPWELPKGDKPCSAYEVNQDVVNKALKNVKEVLEFNSAYMEVLEHMEKVLTNALVESGEKTVSADGFEEKEKAPRNEAQEELTAGR